MEIQEYLLREQAWIHANRNWSCKNCIFSPYGGRNTNSICDPIEGFRMCEDVTPRTLVYMAKSYEAIHRAAFYRDKKSEDK